METIVSYLVITSIFLGVILFTPVIYIYSHPAGELLYSIFSMVCHQITQRSLCVYPDSLSVHSCMDYASNLYSTDERTNEGTQDGVDTVKNKIMIINKRYGKGYKFPVCSRCLAFYTGMFLSGLVFLYLKMTGIQVKLPLWLFMVVLVPFAIDGVMQFLGFWESSNMVRIITGFPPGFLISFYVVPWFERVAHRTK